MKVYELVEQLRNHHPQKEVKLYARCKKDHPESCILALDGEKNDLGFNVVLLSVPDIEYEEE